MFSLKINEFLTGSSSSVVGHCDCNSLQSIPNYERRIHFKKWPLYKYHKVVLLFENLFT